MDLHMFSAARVCVMRMSGPARGRLTTWAVAQKARAKGTWCTEWLAGKEEKTDCLQCAGILIGHTTLVDTNGAFFKHQLYRSRGHRKSTYLNTHIPQSLLDKRGVPGKSVASRWCPNGCTHTHTHTPGGEMYRCCIYRCCMLGTPCLIISTFSLAYCADLITYGFCKYGVIAVLR